MARRLLASFSGATPIGPRCDSDQRSIYELSYSGSPIATTATTETFRITYTIDTSGDNIALGGKFLETVALEVSSSFIDASLVSAPGGGSNAALPEPRLALLLLVSWLGTRAHRSRAARRR